MEYFALPLQNLIEEFEKLPGIGSKTAQRLAFFILNRSKEDAQKFAAAIIDAKESLCYCKVCQNLSDREVCGICDNPMRDHSVICVVESPRDVIQIEKTNEFSGVYLSNVALMLYPLGLNQISTSILNSLSVSLIV